MMFKKTIFGLGMLAILFISANFAFAQDTVLPAQKSGPSEQYSAKYCAAHKECPSGDKYCKKYCGQYELNDLVVLAIDISRVILGVSGSIALLFVVFGGITFMTSGGSQERVTKGKTYLVNASIGLVVIFISWMVISFIFTTFGYNASLGAWNKTTIQTTAK